ncbi:MAG: hypothetical protein HQM13_05260 [SAR324 cluster bacterium]|nr:hypothetical protein [SAR324 cluster bacterium]
MKARKILFFVQIFYLWGLLSTASALSYLDVEKMIRAGMSEELIQAQIEKNNDYFTYDEIIFLKGRKLANNLVEFLLRYHLSFIPDIDVAFLIKMKSVPLSDEIVQMLVDRFGVTSLPLAPNEIIALKNAKVNNKLIEYLINSGK